MPKDGSKFQGGMGSKHPAAPRSECSPELYIIYCQLGLFLMCTRWLNTNKGVILICRFALDDINVCHSQQSSLEVTTVVL